MIFSKADIEAGIMFGPSLANYDVACFGYLAAEELHSKSFTFRIATVT
jgi:hypothetical protein